MSALPGGRVILVRHTAVAAQWPGRCYGRSDVALSRAGRAEARTLAPRLAEFQPDIVYASPLRRARYLAGLVMRAGAKGPLRIDPRLAECHFGDWEGQTWDDIYAASGDAMMGLVHAPGSFRPGGGETTYELRDRAIAWLLDVPRGQTVLAICHGGPIAALAGTAGGHPVTAWPSLVPPYGGLAMLDAPQIDGLFVRAS